MAHGGIGVSNLSIETFSGTKDESIREWSRRFEVLSAAMGWNNDRRLAVMRCYLRGPADIAARAFIEGREAEIAAAAALPAPPVGQPPPAPPPPVTYAELRDHLREALAGPQVERLQQRDFHKMSQSTQSLSEYAFQCLETARKAWPALPQLDVEGLALQKFCETVHEQFRPHLALKRYDRLIEALRDAELLQQVDSERQYQRKQAVHTLGAGATSSPSGEIDLQQIKATLSDIQKRMIEVPRVEGGDRRRGGQREVGQREREEAGGPRCHCCGGVGHFKRECPSRPQASPNPPQPTQRMRPPAPSNSAVICFQCGERGHYASAHRGSGEGRKGNGPQQREGARPRLSGGNAAPVSRNGNERRQGWKGQKAGGSQGGGGQRSYNSANTLTLSLAEGQPPFREENGRAEEKGYSPFPSPPTPPPAENIPSGGLWGRREGDSLVFQAQEGAEKGVSSLGENTVTALWGPSTHGAGKREERVQGESEARAHTPLTLLPLPRRRGGRGKGKGQLHAPCANRAEREGTPENYETPFQNTAPNASQTHFPPLPLTSRSRSSSLLQSKMTDGISAEKEREAEEESDVRKEVSECEATRAKRRGARTRKGRALRHPTLPSRPRHSLYSPSPRFAASLLTMWWLCWCMGLVEAGGAPSSSPQPVSSIPQTNPLLCQSPSSSLRWRLPQEFTCSVQSNDFQEPPRGQSLLIFKENLFAYETEGFLCTKLKTTWKQINWLFHDQREVKEEVETQEVSESECREWEEKKKTEWGALMQSDSFPSVWTVSQPINKAWATPVIGCCAWHEQTAYSVSVQYSPVSKRHSDPYPISTLADLVHCQYDKGLCSLPNKELMIWTVNKTQSCPIVPWRTIRGTRTGYLWLSQDQNIAFSFKASGEVKEAVCEHVVSKTDQGIFVEIVRSQKGNEGERERKRVGRRKVRRRRGRRGRRKREESLETDSFVASRLQALEAYVDKSVRSSFLTNAHSICSLAKATFALTRAQLMTNPTALVRRLGGGEPIVAHYSAGLVEVSHCTELPTGSFSFLPQSQCFRYFVPMSYSIGNMSLSGYLDMRTSQVHKEAGGETCGVPFPRFIPLREGASWLLADGTLQPANTSAFPLFPTGLRPLNLSLRLNHTIFKHFLLYKMNVLRPSLGISSFLHSQGGSKEAARMISHFREGKAGKRTKASGQAIGLSWSEGLFGSLPTWHQLLWGALWVWVVGITAFYCCCPGVLATFRGLPTVVQSWRRPREEEPNSSHSHTQSQNIVIQMRGEQVQRQSGGIREVETEAGMGTKSGEAVGRRREECVIRELEVEEEEGGSIASPPLSPPPSGTESSSASTALSPFFVPKDSVRRARFGTQHPLPPQWLQLLHTPEERLPFLRVTLERGQLTMLWDTAATLSFISKKGEGKLHIPVEFMDKECIKVETVGGSLNTTVSFNSPIQIGNTTVPNHTFHIIPSATFPYDGVLGWDCIKQLKDVKWSLKEKKMWIEGVEVKVLMLPTLPMEDPLRPVARVGPTPRAPLSEDGTEDENELPVGIEDDEEVEGEVEGQSSGSEASAASWGSEVNDDYTRVTHGFFPVPAYRQRPRPNMPAIRITQNTPHRGMRMQPLAEGLPLVRVTLKGRATPTQLPALVMADSASHPTLVTLSMARRLSCPITPALPLGYGPGFPIAPCGPFPVVGEIDLHIMFTGNLNGAGPAYVVEDWYLAVDALIGREMLALFDTVTFTQREMVMSAAVLGGHIIPYVGAATATERGRRQHTLLEREGPTSRFAPSLGRRGPREHTSTLGGQEADGSEPPEEGAATDQGASGQTGPQAPPAEGEAEQEGVRQDSHPPNSQLLLNRSDDPERSQATPSSMEVDEDPSPSIWQRWEDQYRTPPGSPSPVDPDSRDRSPSSPTLRRRPRNRRRRRQQRSMMLTRGLTPSTDRERHNRFHASPLGSMTSQQSLHPWNSDDEEWETAVRRVESELALENRGSEEVSAERGEQSEGHREGSPSSQALNMLMVAGTTLPFVSVTVRTVDCLFLVDTASALSFLSRELVPRVLVQPARENQATERVFTPAGSFRTEGRLDTLLTLANVACVWAQLHILAAENCRWDGIIGRDVLERLGEVGINLAQSTMRVGTTLLPLQMREVFPPPRAGRNGEGTPSRGTGNGSRLPQWQRRAWTGGQEDDEAARDARDPDGMPTSVRLPLIRVINGAEPLFALFHTAARVTILSQRAARALGCRLPPRQPPRSQRRSASERGARSHQGSHIIGIPQVQIAFAGHLLRGRALILANYPMSADILVGRQMMAQLPPLTFRGASVIVGGIRVGGTEVPFANPAETETGLRVTVTEEENPPRQRANRRRPRSALSRAVPRSPSHSPPSLRIRRSEPPHGGEGSSARTRPHQSEGRQNKPQASFSSQPREAALGLTPRCRDGRKDAPETSRKDDDDQDKSSRSPWYRAGQDAEKVPGPSGKGATGSQREGRPSERSGERPSPPVDAVSSAIAKLRLEHGRIPGRLIRRSSPGPSETNAPRRRQSLPPGDRPEASYKTDRRPPPLMQIPVRTLPPPASGEWERPRQRHYPTSAGWMGPNMGPLQVGGGCLPGPPPYPFNMGPLQVGGGCLPGPPPYPFNTGTLQVGGGGLMGPPPYYTTNLVSWPNSHPQFQPSHLSFHNTSGEVPLRQTIELPIVEIQMEGVTIPVLYDTGATISVVPFRTLQKLKLPQENVWPVMEHIHSIAGPVTGTMRMRCRVKLGTADLGVQEFLVIHDKTCSFQGIMGIDITQEAGELALDLRNRTLRVNQLPMPINTVNLLEATRRPTRIRCAKPVTIPPRTGQAVQVRLDPGQSVNLLDQDRDWICEPSWEVMSTRGLLMPRILVHAGPKPFQVIVENPGAQQVKLYANMTLAEAEVPSMALEPNNSTEETSSGHAAHVRLSKEDMAEVNALTPAQPLTRKELLDLFAWPSEDLSPQELSQLQDLIWDHSKAFAKDSYDLGRCGIIKLEIDTGNSPPTRNRPNRVPEALKEEVKAELTKMEAHGIIRPSCSPWSSNMVLVRKKDGTLRCCIDWRRLNAVTRRDSYPLPLISTLLDCLGKAKVMSTLDLASGFWQLELSEEAKPKSAFATMWGLFEYNVAGMGLMNLPSQFQRIMDCVLTGLQHEIALIYLDDILVFSESFSQHLVDLGKVLTRLEQFNLKAKPSKVTLCRQEVKFLGHRVSKEGLQPDDSKVAAIRNLESPKDLKSLQAAIGMLNFYRKFIQGYSTIIAPLYTLLRKGEAFKWTLQHESTFRSLTKRLVEAPILALPDFSIPFTLTTDASNYAIGAVLSQEREGIDRSIAYASRVLNKAEKNYGITEKECLAAVWAIGYFKEYLIGRHFLLITDHSPLKAILTTSTDSPRMLRWSLKMQQYSYTVKYKKGHTNTADGLSRLAEGSNAGVQAETKPAAQVHLIRAQAREDSLDLEAKEGYLLVDPTLKKAQRKDPWLQAIIIYLESGELPAEEAEAARVRKAAEAHEMGPANCLYAKEPNPGAKHKPIAVPAELVPAILAENHDGLGGHLGVARTLYRIRRSYTWQSIYKDTMEYVESCLVCQKTKSPLYKPRAPLVPWIPAEPGQRLYLDIMGPLTTTYEGNKYLIVFQDAATAWTEAFPAPDTKSARIAQLMFSEIFCRYGAPAELCSDQGRNLLAQVVNDLNDLFSVRRLTTSGYRPETMGQIEVGNRVMGSMLRAFCLEKPQEWDRYIPAALLALRSSVSTTRGESPAFLTFGRDLLYPAEAVRTPQRRGYREMEDFRADLVMALQDANRLARQHLVESQARNKKNYDKKIRGTDFVPGQRVWLEMPKSTAPKGSCRKLFIQRLGPYRIVNLDSYPNADIVPVDKPRAKPKTVHVCRLRPCYDPHVPNHETPAPPEEPEVETRRAVELMFPPSWTIAGIPIPTDDEGLGGQHQAPNPPVGPPPDQDPAPPPAQPPARPPQPNPLPPPAPPAARSPRQNPPHRPASPEQRRPPPTPPGRQGGRHDEVGEGHQRHEPEERQAGPMRTRGVARRQEGQDSPGGGRGPVQARDPDELDEIEIVEEEELGQGNEGFLASPAGDESPGEERYATPPPLPTNRRKHRLPPVESPPLRRQTRPYPRPAPARFQSQWD